MSKILFCQDIGVEQEQILTLLNKYNIKHNPVFTAESCNDDVQIIVTVNKPITKEWMAQFPRLQMISVSFTGYDSICRTTCEEREIAVYNAAGYSTDPVAELTIALAQCVMRKLPTSHADMREGKWLPFVGTELAGKTWGVIGTGAIGVRVAELAKAYKCHVIGFSRSHRDDFAKLAEYVAWEKLFRQSDIISVHLPLNEQTKSIIANDEFAQMKSSAIIVNTARGPVICRNALVEALTTKRIAGAALDVYAVEPPEDKELQTLENLVLMPHLAFRTKEALLRKAEITIANISDFLEKREEQNRVI